MVHGWVPDEEARACMACKKGFTTVRRRVRSEGGWRGREKGRERGRVEREGGRERGKVEREEGREGE